MDVVKTERQKEIPAMLNLLDSQLAELDRLLCELRDKLAPVLNPATLRDAEPKAEDPTICTSLGANIYDKCQHAEAICDIARQIIEGVEL